MALPRQFSQVKFRLDKTTDIEHTVKVQNSDIVVKPEYFSGSSFKETIGARRISDIRGFRVEINLSYNASNQADEFQDLFNDLIAAFRDGDDFNGLYVSINSSELSSKFVLEDLSYSQNYRNQIGRFTPSLKVCSEDLIASIPETLQGVL